MPQLAWFMVALSGIAFMVGAGRAAAEFGHAGLIDFLGLAATPSLLALIFFAWPHVWSFPILRPDFVPTRRSLAVTGRIVLIFTCIFAVFGALFGVGWLVRR